MTVRLSLINSVTIPPFLSTFSSNVYTVQHTCGVIKHELMTTPISLPCQAVRSHRELDLGSAWK